MLEHMKTRALSRAKDPNQTLLNRLIALMDCHYYAGMGGADRDYYREISELIFQINHEIQQLKRGVER